MHSNDTEKTNFGFKTIPKKEKESLVSSVFDSVATKYDMMNDLMSFGIHRFWKNVTNDIAAVKRDMKILDLASGTGDLAAKFAKQIGDKGSVILADINDNMLKIGREKLINQGLTKNIFYCKANGERLPFKDNSFDLITIAFGLRNITDKAKALRSMYRTLKPDGKLLVLEFSKPTNGLLNHVYEKYNLNVIPKLGKLITNDESSYRYLAESIKLHPDQEELKQIILDSGFVDVDYFNLSNGIVAVHRAYK